MTSILIPIHRLGIQRPWRLAAALLAAVVLPSLARAQEPAAAKSLARFVPKDDLFFLMEFDGLDAHAAAWNRTAASKLLNEAKLGALLENLATQGLDLMLETAPVPNRPKGQDLVDIVKNLAKQGFLVAAWGKSANQATLACVVRKGDRPDIRKLLALGLMEPENEEIAKAEKDPNARVVHDFGPTGAWWAESGDLVITSKSAVETLSAVIDGQKPSAADHPFLTTMRRKKVDFEPITITYLDLKKMSSAAESPGEEQFGGIQSIEARFGFKDQAIVTQVRIAAPAPRKGFMALLDEPAFGLQGLAAVFAGSTNFTVVSVDPAVVFDRVIELMKSAGPRGDQQAQALIQEIQKRYGLDVKKDLLAHLGSRLTVTTQKVGGPVDTPFARIASRYSGVAIAVDVRDQKALAKTLESVVKTSNEIFKEIAAAPNAPAGGAVLEIKKQPGSVPSYSMDLPAAALPPPLGELFQPTITLGGDRLVIAASRKAAEMAVAAGPPWDAKTALGAVADPLPKSMTYLSVGDLRELTPILITLAPMGIDMLNTQIKTIYAQFGRPAKDVPIELKPDMIPKVEDVNRFLFPSTTTAVVDNEGLVIEQREPVPTLTSLGVGGLLIPAYLPAIPASGEAARRAQCVNNMKQIGLAMHNHHAAKNVFPQAVRDKDGKPLLSWRVAILPYIEQQELYNKFHLDEPWDSEHNKALIKEMPAVYLCPSRAKAEPFTTSYRTFVGKGALFDEKEDTGLQVVTDGTSNTILVVEAKDAVTWTKPDDIKFDPEAKGLQGADSNHPGGFNALFADGSVRFIKKSINELVWRALITRAGGEVVSSDSY